MPLGIKPTVDFAFKKIFGSPENVSILVGLLNAILNLKSPIVHVDILNPFSYQDFEEDKLVVLDIRARDSSGRLLNVEMQVSITSGLLNRLVYYACSMYVDQLEAGSEYADLRPAISICLLDRMLFPVNDAPSPHHRFRLIDPEHKKEISDSIEVHTVELRKYNLNEETIHQATAIEQWAFFFLFADQYEPDRLRELLPGVEFQQAITVAEGIKARTEDRVMYDQREKAQRDYLWHMEGAKKEGWKEGHQQGLEEGRTEGREEGRTEGREEGREEGAIVGKMQLIQQLLGEEVSSADRLLENSLDDLSKQLAALQERLRSRS